MYARDPNQVVWPHEALQDASAPASTKEFLSTTGLPPFVANLSVEFGICDDQADPLVIGGDGEDCVVVDREGVVRIRKGGHESRSVFVNSSVQSLSQFLDCMIKLQALGYTDARSFRQDLSHMRDRMRKIDGAALIDDRDHVWSALINDMDSMAF